MPLATPISDASITVIVPLCNEEESIEILREKLATMHRRLNTRFVVEYCLIDDGSTDRTGEFMHSVVPQGAAKICLSHKRNRGLGAALRTGLRAATGSIVCTIDADCSYPPEDLEQLIHIVFTGEADVAVASPYHPDGQVVGVKPWRLLLSRQCSRLYRFCSPIKLHTYTSIFRAYRGTIAAQMEFSSDGFVSAAEMLFCAHRLGARITEVPLTLRARQRGYSKIRIARTMWTHAGMLMSLLITRIRNQFHIYGAKFSAQLRDKDGAPGLSVTGTLGKEDHSA